MNTCASPSFDKNWMLAQIGGDLELLHEVAKVFLDDSPRLVEGLNAALRADNSTALHAAAHATKSAVGNFGALAAVHAAQTLERACKSEDHVHYAPLCEQLIAEVEHLLGELRVELNEA